MNAHPRHVLAGAVLLVTMAATSFGDQDYDLAWFSIDGGGGLVSADGFVLDGVIGQPDAGVALTGGSFSLYGGFGGADPSVCAPDVSGDGQVDVADLLAVLADWGECGPSCPADVTGDGVVDVSDLLDVLVAWGLC